MTPRDELHSIIDSILEENLTAAREALAPLADPVWMAMLNAPIDDEPLTEEDLTAIAEGREDARYGRTIKLEDLVAARTGASH